LRTKDRDQVFTILEAANHWHLAIHAKDRAFLHAGAVAYKGQAILLPGRSTAGKSTLVAALLKLGAEFYSDEFAVLDAEGNVHPFPRRLSLGGDSAHKGRRRADELGAKVAEQPRPVGLVALAEYRSGAEWQPRRVSAGIGAQAMMANTISQTSFQSVALPAFRRLIERVEIWKGRRGEADETAARILRMLD
jgi:hypothetical protein